MGRSRSEHYFPEKVTFNILTWTCVTSLLRCRSVCKLWLSIISKPIFIETHQNNAHKIPSILMITEKQQEEEQDEEEEDEKLEDESSYQRRTATINYSNSPQEFVNLHLMPPFDNMDFVSSWNGIVCVCNARGDDIYLFNPLTRLSKRLPRREEEIPIIVVQQDVVFGFDSVSHDFKVLRIKYQKVDDSVLVSVLEVELYSLNADSWRVIEVNVTLPSFVQYPFCPVLISGPVVNGVLYLEGTNEIVTLDMDKEMFGVFPFPSFMQRRKSKLLDFEGSVAVVVESVRDGSPDEEEFSLWAVSDELFWNKMFTFDSGLEIDWVFLCLDANQFVVTTRLGTVLYDYRKKETKYIGLPSQSFLLRVLKHNESFLSVEGFEERKSVGPGKLNADTSSSSH